MGELTIYISQDDFDICRGQAIGIEDIVHIR